MKDENNTIPKVKLTKFLAEAGIASRRQADEIVRGGEVTVNNTVILDPAFTINPKKDVVRAFEKKVVKTNKSLCYAFYKPTKAIATLVDPLKRKSLSHFLGDLPRLLPIGNLSFYQEGLLLLTNDNELIQIYTAKNMPVLITYEIKIKGILTREEITKLENKFKSIDKNPHRVSLKPIKKAEKNSWLEFTYTSLTLDRIANTFRNYGHMPLKWFRTRFSIVKIGDLQPGMLRLLNKSEFDNLKRYNKVL